MKTSMRMPAAMAKANSRNGLNGTTARTAKLSARVMPATLIALVDLGTATLMASTSGRSRASAQM